jgi:hypothetical protein
MLKHEEDEEEDEEDEEDKNAELLFKEHGVP